jgi:hypothetical protein
MSLTTNSFSNPKARGPLSPLNLLLAGVPARDVVWFKRLGPGDQMRALSSSERGGVILNKVREYQMRSSGAALPHPA